MPVILDFQIESFTKVKAKELSTVVVACPVNVGGVANTILWVNVLSENPVAEITIVFDPVDWREEVANGKKTICPELVIENALDGRVTVFTLILVIELRHTLFSEKVTVNDDTIVAFGEGITVGGGGATIEKTVDVSDIIPVE